MFAKDYNQYKQNNGTNNANTNANASDVGSGAGQAQQKTTQAGKQNAQNKGQATDCR